MYISRKKLEYFGEPIGCSSDITSGKDRNYYGGGKDGGDAPDYTDLASASKYAADVAKQLGDKQLEEAQRQYDLNRSVSAPVAAAQLGLMNQQQVQGDDYYNYMKSYSRPTEQSLYYEAMGFTPDEIQQIETARAQETAAFKSTQAAKTPATIATSFEVPTYTTEKDIPQGAVSGADLKYIKLAGQQQNGISQGMGLSSIALNSPVKADPNSYYIKNANGTYSVVGVKDKLVEGSKTVTVDAPSMQVDDYETLQTPETDALIAKLTAQASERKKAEDAAGRQKITDLSTNLATRVGESDVDVYNRNKGDIDAETGQAVADARSGYTNAMNNAIRQGIRYGFSPDKLAAAASTQTTDQATKQAQAANTTRKAATQTMYQRGIGESSQLLSGANTDRSNKIQDESINTAKKLDVAGLYRNLPGTSQGAYGLSLNAGNSAVQNNAQAGTNLIAANQGAANTILQGTQQQISGLTGIVNSQTSINNANSGGDGGLGAVGTVVGAGIAAY